MLHSAAVLAVPTPPAIRAVRRFNTWATPAGQSAHARYAVLNGGGVAVCADHRAVAPGAATHNAQVNRAAPITTDGFQNLQRLPVVLWVDVPGSRELSFNARAPTCFRRRCGVGWRRCRRWSYPNLIYDIKAGRAVDPHRPDTPTVEGLTVSQPALPGKGRLPDPGRLADFF